MRLRSIRGGVAFFIPHMKLFLLLFILSPAIPAAGEVGPYVGSVTTTEAHFLYRPGESEQDFRLVVLDNDGTKIASAKGRSEKKNDFVAKFHLVGLEDGTDYRYRIEQAGRVVVDGEDLTFRTVDADRKTKVTAVLLSCVKKKDTAPVWEEIRALKPDILCLSGDTPYIDTSNLNSVRAKHRAFLQEEPLAKIGKRTSVVGTWDDHDFGRNNGNGLSMGSGARATRQGFVEYRAHARFGGNDGGIYHKSDLGAVEIFHLDPRTFSQLEPSPVDSEQTTCFGKTQWEWLRKSLKESKAPFKVLSMGAIWQDKGNSETDDMFTYWYERDALFDFIREERIGGVVLHGGDIHVSRYLRHPQRVGYDLHDFIVSPGHLSVIPSLNPYHPSLEWSLVEGQQFLTLEVDPGLEDPVMTATFRQPGETVNHVVRLKLSDLQPAPRRETLRARWSFDRDFKNSSILGDRLDGQAHGGADVSSGSLRLERKKEQFVVIPRSFLDDNSAGHSVACWIKPSSLPKHGSGDRHFIYESNAAGKPDDKQAWHLSLELSAAFSEPTKVAVRAHTHTLAPASAPQKAPAKRSSGPFTVLVHRNDLAGRWNQLVAVFDSKSLVLYLNGELLVKHPLPVPGPAAEFGGLVIGGHRVGTGRNFDGCIDELSVWQEVLTPAKVAALFRHEKPLFAGGGDR